MFGKLTRRRFVALSAVIASAVASFSFALPARSDDYEDGPIIINTGKTFTAGALLPCEVYVGDAPANIHITSDPPGVVSYDGSVDGGHSVVEAKTNPDADSGTVTVYLNVEGRAETASDVTAVREDLDSYEDGPIIINTLQAAASVMF